MTTFFIILFIFSTLTAFLMLTYKAWLIKEGVVNSRNIEKGRAVISPNTFVTMKNSMLYYARRLSNVVVMLLLRVWVIVSHGVSKKVSEWIPEKTPEEKSKSQFLRTITIYKNRMKRMRERIEEKEEQKEEQKEEIS